MAQKLKEDLRAKIERAALDSMLENGIENCNMRSIALKAGCTTGNLYRYFENKERLILSIIQPIMSRLNELISNETEGTLQLLQGEVKLPESEKGQKPSEYFISIMEEKLYNVLSKLGEEGKKHPKRMKILINANSVNEKLIEWAIELFKTIFYNCFEINENYRVHIDIFIRVLTQTFCNGMLEIFKETENLSQNIYQQMIELYLDMQLSGIRVLIDKKIEENIITPNKEVFNYGY